MPWCPKCKYEYRSEITQCSQCEEALVDDNPNPPESRVRLRPFLSLTSLYIVSPWIWYLSVAALFRITHPEPRDTMNSWDIVALLVPTVALAVAAFLYGFSRKTASPVLSFALAAIVGGLAQFGICMSLAVLRLINEGYKAFAFPFWTAPISIAVLFLIWFGGKMSYVLARRRLAKE